MTFLDFTFVTPLGYCAVVEERVVRMECMMLSNDGPQLRVMVILFQTGGGPLFLRRQRLHKLFIMLIFICKLMISCKKKGLSFLGYSSS